MCKHVAAVLYGVGARLDERPELLFQLRGVDAGDLLVDLDGAAPALRPAGARMLENEDVSTLFGLDLSGSDDADGGVRPPRRRAAPTTRSQPEDARQGRPAPPGEAMPAKVSMAAPTRKAGVAKPISPKAKAFRPSPAPARPKRARLPASAPALGAPVSGVLATMPAAFKEPTAAQFRAAKKLDRKAAEKAVADVIARIGQHLVMEADPARAGQLMPKAGARDVRVHSEPAAGSGVRTPGRRKPAVGPAKKRKAAV